MREKTSKKSKVYIKDNFIKVNNNNLELNEKQERAWVWNMTKLSFILL